jgi:hypothetical protein
VFTQDLFEPSIRLKEDISVLAPGISSGKDSSVPVSRTPPSKDEPTLISEANPGASAGPTGLNRKLRGEIAVVVRPPNPDVEWQKLISKYLRLGTIPDDKTETGRLARRAKGYLTNNDKLYHHSTSHIL